MWPLLLGGGGAEEVEAVSEGGCWDWEWEWGHSSLGTSHKQRQTEGEDREQESLGIGLCCTLPTLLCMLISALEYTDIPEQNSISTCPNVLNSSTVALAPISHCDVLGLLYWCILSDSYDSYWFIIINMHQMLINFWCDMKWQHYPLTKTFVKVKEDMTVK